MPNHFHLIMETPEANLVKAMHGINSSFTIYFNHRHKRVGHLLQGRYKSILVDKDSYLMSLSRYVHLNPVRANLVKEPGQYQWSSYSGFVDARKAISWVKYHEILALFSDQIDKAREQYKNFVEKVSIHDMKNPLEDVYRQAVLGGKEFINRVEDYLTHTQSDQLEGFRRLVYEGQDPHYIIEVVADVLKVPVESILAKQKRSNTARKVALFMTQRYCRLSNREIGELFGGIQGSAISKAAAFVEQEIMENQTLRGLVSTVKSHFKV